MKREYRALELVFQRTLAGATSLEASWAWSRNYGNYEGYWDQSIGTNDPVGAAAFMGLTGAGPEHEWPPPNDQTHVLKLFGSQSFRHGIGAGATLIWAPARRWSELGASPFGLPVLRISQTSAAGGRTPSTYDFNLRLSWSVLIDRGGSRNIRLIADAYHIGNPRRVVFVDQIRYRAVTSSGVQVSPNPGYGKPLAFQPPAAVRLGDGGGLVDRPRPGRPLPEGATRREASAPSHDSRWPPVRDASSRIRPARRLFPRRRVSPPSCCETLRAASARGPHLCGRARLLLPDLSPPVPTCTTSGTDRAGDRAIRGRPSWGSRCSGSRGGARWRRRRSCGSAFCSSWSGAWCSCTRENLVVLAHPAGSAHWRVVARGLDHALPARPPREHGGDRDHRFFNRLHEPGGDGAAPPAGPSVAAAQHPDVYLPSQFRGRGARELSRDCAQPLAPRRLRGAGDGELPSRRATRRGRHGWRFWRASHRMLARPAAIKLIRTESITQARERRRRLSSGASSGRRMPPRSLTCKPPDVHDRERLCRSRESDGGRPLLAHRSRSAAGGASAPAPARAVPSHAWSSVHASASTPPRAPAQHRRSAGVAAGAFASRSEAPEESLRLLLPGLRDAFGPDELGSPRAGPASGARRAKPHPCRPRRVALRDGSSPSPAPRRRRGAAG